MQSFTVEHVMNQTQSRRFFLRSSVNELSRTDLAGLYTNNVIKI